MWIMQRQICLVPLSLVTFFIVSASSAAEPPCSAPEQIEHGLANWDAKSGIARYACYQGYHLVGPPQLECRYGRWYSDAKVTLPTCKPVVCNHPKIENGRLKTGENVRYRSGEKAEVVCNDGYELKSSNRIACKEDGSWESADHTEFPTCKEKTCPYPDNTVPMIENGSIEVNGNRVGLGGDYKPGSVALYSCQPGFVLVPLSAGKKVCRKGSWEGHLPACIDQSESQTSKTHCPAPPSIANGYYFTDRSSSETPLALPKVAEGTEKYERGTIARYHCKDGYTLSSFHGQEIYRCQSDGKWAPRVPPVCISMSSTNLNDPLEQVMCPSPPPIPYADFERVEGWLTSNGAIHGTVLEYTCRVGYRDSVTPCLPTRRTCHAGQWIGRKPTCIPFDFCERPPIISHGYMRSPSENGYHVLSEVQYECHIGYKMKGSNVLKCSPTGCWTPIELPECIREDHFKSKWSTTESSQMPVVAILISISVGCSVIALTTTVCLIVLCRRKGGPIHPPSGPAHWSTTVTVTPECRPREPVNQRFRQEQDRMALIAFADGVQQVTLPSYEEALRDGPAATSATSASLVEYVNGQTSAPVPYSTGRRAAGNNGYCRVTPNGTARLSSHHHHASRSRSRHHTAGDGGQNVRFDNADALSHHSVHAWPPRQHRRRRDHDAMSDSASHHSVQVWSGSGHHLGHPINSSSSKSSNNSESIETVGTHSQGQVSSVSTESNTLTSADGTSGTGCGIGPTGNQTPSCRALAGSLASFDASVVNTEGVPLLEEHELETEGSSSSVSGETGSATYSETSSKTQ